MASNIITSDGKDLDERYLPKGTSIPPHPKAHLVDSWDDGTNWWRKWSDGRLEQGGRVTSKAVNFLVPFANTNYTFFSNPEAEIGQNYVGWGSSNRKNNSISIIDWGEYTSTKNFMWYANGRY